MMGSKAVGINQVMRATFNILVCDKPLQNGFSESYQRFLQNENDLKSQLPFIMDNGEDKVRL